MKKILLALSILLAPALATAVAPLCFSYINRTTYGAGFQNGDLCFSNCGKSTSATYGVVASGGSLVMQPVPHDVNNIRLPYEQDVNLRFIGEQASYTYAGGSQGYDNTYGGQGSSASHIMNWFYYDTDPSHPLGMASFLDQWGNLKDNDGDGIPDFFQTSSWLWRPRNGLYIMSDSSPSPGAPDLANNYYNWWACWGGWGGGGCHNFSDGGYWPYVPNLVEEFVTNGGGNVWELDDDDNDSSYYRGLPLSPDNVYLSCWAWWWCWGAPQPDGAPDYDVDANGAYDDYVTHLGEIGGNREFVFHYESYNDVTVQAEPLGLPWYLNYSSPWIPQALICEWVLVPVTYCWWVCDWWGCYWYCETIWVWELVCYWAYWTPAAGGGWWHENWWEDQADKMSPYWGEWSWEWPSGWWNASMDTPNMSYFSKAMLNSDRYPRTTGWPAYTVKTIDIGQVWPNYDWWTSTQGWLNSDQWNRLWSLGITLPAETHTISSDGVQSPHAFLGAPFGGAYRNLWLLGFEDLPLQNQMCPSPFYTCKDPASYNNTVFWMQTENGGGAVSNNLSSDCAAYPGSCIPGNYQATSSISKVHISNFRPSFNGCGQVPINSRADLYYSIDDGLSWHEVVFPADTPSEVTIDTLSQGYSGKDLRWKLNLVQGMTDPGCQISVPAFNVGYEAIQTGETGQLYQLAEVLPVANAMLRGQFETRSSNVTDVQPRGHMLLHRIYNPDGANVADVPPKLLWDAGQVLANQDANQFPRNIWYNDWGTITQFAQKPTCWWGGAWCGAWDLGQWIMPISPIDNRNENGKLQDGVYVNGGCLKRDGKCVYDINGDNNVDDSDANEVVRWTLGWEVNSGANRPWKLGAFFHSTPAIMTPPSEQWWLKLSATPPNELSAMQAPAGFNGLNANRQTIAIVGATDGMVHAFNMGYLFGGDDPTTPSVEAHGYFQKLGGVRNYGDGSEVWAYIPTTQMKKLINNMPNFAGYKPEQFPRASMDGSVSIDDIVITDWWTGPHGHTVAVIGDGDSQPRESGNPAYSQSPTFPASRSAWDSRQRYLVGLDVTSPTQPALLWGWNDWTDPDFNGITDPVALGPVQTPFGRYYGAATHSGLAGWLDNEYFYVIDATTGGTLIKTWLNNGGGVWGALAQGFVGSPIGVDSDGDGMYDRYYMADTNGRIYKVNVDISGTASVCFLYNLGEPIWSAMELWSPTAGQVQLYVGTGSNPEIYSAGGQYHFYGFQDNDAKSKCTTATKMFTVSLPPGAKSWARPAIAGGLACFSADNGNALDMADGPQGQLQCGSHTSTVTCVDQNGGAQVWSSTMVGDAVGGLRGFDGHLVVNGITGGTQLFGSGNWNNPPTGVGGSSPGQAKLPTTSWAEQ